MSEKSSQVLIEAELEIITREADIDFTKDCCMFGSKQHKQFIKNKMKKCNSGDKQLYEKQLDILENNIEHATFEVFGRIPNLKVIRHPKEGIFHPFRVRQYLIDNILHREEEERKTSWMELFFDLIFVGVIAQLGHAVQHHLDARGIWEYFIKFSIVWRVWAMQVMFMNRFFSNDLTSKLYLLVIAAIAIGLSLNIGDYGIQTWFIAFYLFNEFVNLVGVLFFSIMQKQFFKDLNCGNIVNLFLLLPVFIAFAVEGDIRTMLLTIHLVAAVYLTLPLISMVNTVLKPKHRTALNIEHWSERYGLFSIIVLGESIIAILNSTMDKGVYPTSVLGMTVVASIQWIYFDVDSAKQYLHAIRRSRVTGILWYNLHLPLHASIAFSGACLGVLIHDIKEETKYSKKAQSGYIISLGFILFFMALIGLTHKSLDKQENRVLRLSKKFRILFRLCVAIVLIILGSSLYGIGFYPTVIVGLLAALFFSLVIVEEWGRLEVVKAESFE